MLPCIIGLSGPTLTEDERALFREAEPAGFLLFARNCLDPEQLRRLTDALRDLTGRADTPILIDQEGGRVCRLGPPHWPSFPPPAPFGDLYQRAPISGMEAARVNAAAVGAVLRQAGINVACTPVLDLHHPHASDIVGDRSFGADPLAVASLGRAVLDGLAEAGVAGIVKHMPGHGRAQTDSHFTLPVVEASEEELEKDLTPFRRLAARAGIGMTAHIVYQAWDAERPATLSPRVIGDVIRGRIGFDGLLISDDIVMEALEGSVEDRALGALAAGCDLVLHGSGVLAEAQRLFAALPPLTAAAGGRMARAIVTPEATPGPLHELIKERDALLGLLA
jgi:beta-N-acetylhexosaminidase